MFTLTVRGIGRDGQPAALGLLTVRGIDHPDVPGRIGRRLGPGPRTGRAYLFSGEYAANVKEVFTETLLIDPEFRMAVDAEVVLDAGRHGGLLFVACSTSFVPSLVVTRSTPPANGGLPVSKPGLCADAHDLCR